MSSQPPDLDPDVAGLLRRDSLGLVAAVVARHGTGEVLMLGWMDDEALRRTLTTGRATYWSRSRREYWVKGETSGNRQYVRTVALDCDGDALLVTVEQVGSACHTGSGSCFSRPLPAVPGAPASEPGVTRAAGSRPGGALPDTLGTGTPPPPGEQP